jgi:hypothetical protein
LRNKNRFYDSISPLLQATGNLDYREARLKMNFNNFLEHLDKANTSLLLTLLVVFSAMLIANMLYYRTLQRTMCMLSPELRPFPPGLVWLALLPYLGIVWYMIYIIMLSLGIRKELAKRGQDGTGGLGISIATVILFALCLFPGTRLLVIVPTLAMWIVHWQRMSVYLKRLSEQDYLLVA